jgi:hypothetical protein
VTVVHTMGISNHWEGILVNHISWYFQALKALGWGVVYVLAVFGVGAVAATVQVARGAVEPDDVGRYAALIQTGWQYISGLGFSGVFAVFTRYAVPAYMQYKARLAAQAHSNLADVVTNAVLARIGSTTPPNA